MKPYQKTYLETFGYKVQSDIVSEISGAQANVIHHIHCKGMGGSKQRDNIENLIALTDFEHEFFGDKTKYLEYLQETHDEFLKNNRII